MGIFGIKILTNKKLEMYCDNARAYGYEIGKGQPLVRVVESSEDNPFLNNDWRDRVENNER